jgi:hypothetical protein
MGEFALGQPVSRFEDPRLLRGGGRHVDNMVPPPDMALLAIMEKGPGPLADLAAARDQLAGERIGSELLTPDNYMPRDEPCLHFD